MRRRLASLGADAPRTAPPALALLLALLSAGFPSTLGGAPAPGTPVLGAVVHRAYRYAGIGGLKADPGSQLVAVDVEFRGSTSGLDLDDVEIVDSRTEAVLEAAPEVAFLQPDGRFFSWREAPPAGLRRCLLIFQVPEGVRSILLRHWGESLTRRPVEIRPSGPTLPPERPARAEPGGLGSRYGSGTARNGPCPALEARSA